MLAAVLAVALVVVGLAAERIVLVTRSGVLMDIAIVLIDADFAMCFEALPAIENSEIFWVVVASTFGDLWWHIL